MRKLLLFLLSICFLICLNLKAAGRDSLDFQTQLSFSGLLQPDPQLHGTLNVRALPQLDYLRDFSGDRRLSAEVSTDLNLNTNATASSLQANASLGLYRAWVRYSTQRNEIRAGLQQLNFGSAAVLRPLQWFDALDPTDPLHRTEGVWGVLDRLYFKNNATLWLWGLYGNTSSRVWDQGVRSLRKPEWGFRYQQPVPAGEMALSLNHRTVQTNVLGGLSYRETKIGLDGKWDLGPGLWFEDSYTMTSRFSPLKMGLNFLTLGTDWTPELLDGVSITLEHMAASSFSVDDDYRHTTHFSALMATWPIDIVHRVSGIAFYSWGMDAWFRYLTWTADFDRSSFHVIAFWNPSLTGPVLPIGTDSFSKYGVQLMYVLQI